MTLVKNSLTLTLVLCALLPCAANPVLAKEVCVRAQALSEVADAVSELKTLAQENVYSDDEILEDVTLDEIATETRGGKKVVLLMTQPQAEAYCTGKGKRLPTIRELAASAQDLGAIGIKETIHRDTVKTDPFVVEEIKQMAKDGFTPIVLENAAHEAVVDFYFNSTDYVRPKGDLGTYLFWSSSKPVGLPDSAFGLDGVRGGIHVGRMSFAGNSAVRCVK